MKTPNRDLLVLVKDDHLNEEAIEFHLAQLNRMLQLSEAAENLSIAHEVADLNRYRFHHKPVMVKKIMAQQKMKPFVFIINKN